MAKAILALTVFVASLFVGGASDVDGVVNRTHKVIGELQELDHMAHQRFVDPGPIYAKLDEAGTNMSAEFDSSLYSQKVQAFSKFAQHASDAANESLSAKNRTHAEVALNNSEMAFEHMMEVSAELDSMEKTFHDKLQLALNAVVKPELVAVTNASKMSSHLQHGAHSMMDPLYSWGDAAEDEADVLNDLANNAQSSVEKVLRNYRRVVTDGTNSVQQNFERKVFVGPDRTAAWRKVHKQVQSARGNLASASGNLLSLPLGSIGGAGILLTSAIVSGFVGAFVSCFISKRQASSCGKEQSPFGAPQLTANLLSA